MDDFEVRRTSFGGAAGAYAAVRPRWSEESVHWLLGSPDRSLEVVDLGAGTGLGTRAVATLGHHVLAVEPSPEMVAALHESFAWLPAGVAERVSTRLGPAESLELPAQSVDAVTSFQAWHWFDADRATSECVRVLRPGGWLGLAWNAWSPEAPWVHELASIVGSPEMVWQPEAGAEGVRAPALAGFFAPETHEFELRQVLTVEEMVRLASSWSQVAVRVDRDDVLADVRRLATRAARDQETLTFPYVSACFRYRRREVAATA